MKKSVTKDIYICDFHTDGEEVVAVGKVQPSGEDVCETHMRAFTEEIRLPEELGGDMSGYKVAVTPDYDAKMVIKYTKEKTK